MSIYPIPDAAWISKFPSCAPDIISDALRFGFLKDSREKESAFSSAFNKINNDEDRFVKVRDSIFPFLFFYLYMQWFLIERPRAALEDLILDFRDVPLVSYNDIHLLGIVAGIAESSSETYCERLPKAVKLHNKLYATAQECLEKMLGAA